MCRFMRICVGVGVCVYIYSNDADDLDAGAFDVIRRTSIINASCTHTHNFHNSWVKLRAHPSDEKSIAYNSDPANSYALTQV